MVAEVLGSGDFGDAVGDRPGLGMRDLFRVGPWVVLVAWAYSDLPLVSGGVRWLRGSCVAGGPGVAVADVIVEVRRNAGSVLPCGMVGGSYFPGEAGRLELGVVASGELTLGAAAGYVSGISGSGMVLGLPDEFAESVVEGVVLAGSRVRPSAGRVLVDRAAYDEMNSSPLVFQFLGGLFVVVVDCLSRGCSELPARVRGVVSGW